MADWIYNTARVLNFTEVIIDIINQTYVPESFNFHPFTYELPFLKIIIEKNLVRNGFDKDFIIEAKIRILIIPGKKSMLCESWIIDQENRKYQMKSRIINTYEDDFDPRDLKIKSSL
jgi:hypothetical protein